MKFILGKEIVVVEVMIAVVLVMLGCWIGYGFRPESDIPTVYVDQRGRYQGSNGSVLLMTLDETPIVELPQIQPTWLPFTYTDKGSGSQWTPYPQRHGEPPSFPVPFEVPMVEFYPRDTPHPSAEIDSPKPRGAF